MELIAQCPICVQVMREPVKTIPCHHVFCMQCLVYTQENQTNLAPCALCRTTITAVVLPSEDRILWDLCNAIIREPPAKRLRVDDDEDNVPEEKRVADYRLFERAIGLYRVFKGEDITDSPYRVRVRDFIKIAKLSPETMQTIIDQSTIQARIDNEVEKLREQLIAMDAESRRLEKEIAILFK